MGKIQCDICGSELVMLAGGRGAVCKNCGLEYSIERLREMLSGGGQSSAPIVQTPAAPEERMSVDTNAMGLAAEKHEVLTESSEQDFVLKKQFMGGYKLVGYKGCAQRVTFPAHWIEYDDHKLFEAHDEMVELIFPVGYTNTAFEKGNFENKPRLKKVIFGGDVLTSADDFKGCKALKHVAFENATMIQLGVGTFSDCVALESLRFSEDAEFDIQPEVFKNCRALKTFVAPRRSVDFAGEGIESGTFEGCTALQRVVLPGNIKAIHKNAFKNCISLESVTTHDGDLRTVAIHPEAFSGSSFQPANAGFCPQCGKQMRCSANEMNCVCGFSAMQYEV